MVLKDDPTLMFTNAGMNQFKDYFLGNKAIKEARVADTQKCLRVSGKHNDLDEVGYDTYHHTMFEMLGNWSFGDYFKEEAIAWAWELLTEVYGIDKDRLYVSVFDGDKEDGLERDKEAANIWLKYVPEDRIIGGSKKDNFWEMGDTGPSGPCSEIHADIRSDADRKKIDGKSLVNQDHPEVIEIWNLVFIQYNRKADGSLEQLPAKHIDTGMGFERLCMVLQGVKSNYDTDVFTPLIHKIEQISDKQYGNDEKADIAMRVVADHCRAIAFAIADGQLPSNTGAGYVIRRILRRAVRYGYSFLNLKEPFIHELISVLEEQLSDTFPELKSQRALVKKVIKEEEIGFLRTLESGLKRLDSINSNISGQQAFELYDTYGFPFDLTKLIAAEKGLQVDEAGFNEAMKEQKDRSRHAQKTEAGDWVELLPNVSNEFVGYDRLLCPAKIVKYRTVKQKDKEIYQIVLDKTPFYAESGGQVGDKGVLDFGEEEIAIYDTKKENDLIVHYANKLPSNPEGDFVANVRSDHRVPTVKNHSATHLLHAALRVVLGDHVQQKGSLVAPDRFRFDFSHFAKMTDEELERVERIVNERIWQNIPKDEKRNVPFNEALESGAMALFGEKYGDEVRMITFDPEFSVELCGGTHVDATGEIGLFKITSESAIAAGIRRIEAITGETAKAWLDEKVNIVSELREVVKNKDVRKGVSDLLTENAELKSKLEALVKEQSAGLKDELRQKIDHIHGVNFIGQKIDLNDGGAIKDLAFQIKKEVDGLFLVLAAESNGKALLTVMISDNLVAEKGWNAGNIIRDLAKHIQGGGGGQPFYATAGGKNTAGLENAIQAARAFVAKG